MSYLAAASVARARWALQSMLEGEAKRRGEFWAQNRKALQVIVEELAGVIDA